MKNPPASDHFIIRTLTVWAILAACVAILPARPVLCIGQEAAATSEPIHITADRLVADTQSDTARFSGNVTAVQGNAEIKADQLTVHYQSKKQGGAPADEETTEIRRITARGRVRITFDNRLAVSEQAVYITSERKLILEGPGSKIISGRDEIVGSKITYYRNDGRVAMEGDGENRVKAVLHSDQRGLN